MNYTKEQYFLRHLLTLIDTEVNELDPLSKNKSDFESGRTIAYYEVADFIVECSRLFEVPLEDLGLVGFNPDKLL